MKICTIVGARPQFIKAAVLSRVLRQGHHEVVIHTGQHYDRNMSDIFFEELQIPKPDYNLGVSGLSHGKMTGHMLIAAEDVLLAERPQLVLVYGDTNSTLAGALAAVKLQIPVAHVEAGCRTQDINSPEEINRILVDRISVLLFCATQAALEAQKKENLSLGAYFTGDLMYDAALYYGDKAMSCNHEILGFDNNKVVIPKQFYLLTCHRQENTETDENLFQILFAMNELDKPTIYPIHPRNRERAHRVCAKHCFDNIILVQPVGYMTSLYLIRSAAKVVTDSGGVQREAYFFSKQCITVMDHAAWPETLVGNINQMTKPKRDDIIQKLSIEPYFSKKTNQFGDGHSAEKIAKRMDEFVNERTTNKED